MKATMAIDAAIANINAILCSDSNQPYYPVWLNATWPTPRRTRGRRRPHEVF
jgi:hypothetical protein